LEFGLVFERVSAKETPQVESMAENLAKMMGVLLAVERESNTVV